MPVRTYGYAVKLRWNLPEGREDTLYAEYDHKCEADTCAREIEYLRTVHSLLTDVYVCEFWRD